MHYTSVLLAEKPPASTGTETSERPVKNHIFFTCFLFRTVKNI